jgi:hypothetical protein
VFDYQHCIGPLQDTEKRTQFAFVPSLANNDIIYRKTPADTRLTKQGQTMIPML